MKNDANERKKLAIAWHCKTWLRVNGFLSEKESRNVRDRILKYQDRNRIEISEAQMDSVSSTYDDNATNTDEL